METSCECRIIGYRSNEFEIERCEHCLRCERMVALAERLAEMVHTLQGDLSPLGPQSCGACGTPMACCDMDCVVAATLSKHLGDSSRLLAEFRAAKESPRPSEAPPAPR